LTAAIGSVHPDLPLGDPHEPSSGKNPIDAKKGAPMPDLEAIRRETRETLGLPADADLGYINDELVARYLAVEEAGEPVAFRREDGSSVTDSEMAAIASEAEIAAGSTTRYGNHPMRLGTCFYWITNGVGAPCGSGFTGKACNWRSVQQTQLTYCSGYWGYRFTFTY